MSETSQGIPHIYSRMVSVFLRRCFLVTGAAYFREHLLIYCSVYHLSYFSGRRGRRSNPGDGKKPGRRTWRMEKLS